MAILLPAAKGFAATGTDDVSSRWLSAPVDSVWQYTEYSTQPMPDEDRWWTGFNDDTLNRLIALAIQNNYDAKGALSRIRASRAQMQAMYAGYYLTIDASIGYDLQRESGVEVKPYRNATTSSFFTAGLSASWEIDIFGRVAANVKAGKAALAVSRLDYDGVMVSLAANVATRYFSLLTSRLQLANAKEHIKSQTAVLKIVEARYEAGLVAKLDVAQSKTVLLSTESSIPSLETSEIASLNALATLCGVQASDIEALVRQSAELPAPVTPHAIGLPADLIRRRPDLVMAEQNLALLSARVGIAKKDFLPTLSLQAQAGVGSHSMNKLFTHDAFYYMVAPTLSWTIFNGLERKRNVEAAKFNLEEAIAEYNNTVLNAVGEVNNALAQFSASRRQCELLALTVGQCREALSLAMERYKLGLVDFSDVATTLQDLLQYQNSLISAKGNALAADVTLYESLGGGWQPENHYDK